MGKHRKGKQRMKLAQPRNECGERCKDNEWLVDEVIAYLEDCNEVRRDGQGLTPADTIKYLARLLDVDDGRLVEEPEG